MAKQRKADTMNVWVYDLVLWLLSVLVDLFFREVHPRSSWKVPKKGAVVFVAAPHANQFVDPLILMRVLRLEAHRRVAWLIAEKSLKRQFIGSVASAFGAVSVGRALDLTKPAKGKIYLPDPENDPTLVRGVETNFEDKQFQVGGLVVLPSVNNAAANSEISEISGPEELRVKKPFKGSVAMKQLTGKEDQNGKAVNGDSEPVQSDEKFQGTSFKVAPKVDQSKVYERVFALLSAGGCVGIFPEGGSHDRTELLPLKAGVAIMALGAMAEDPDCNLKIVPCGMNYFHPHKFRSRAVVEFGSPLDIPPELVEAYKNGDRREAIGKMLDLVYNALVAVTVTAPDYDTLMLIQAVRRLYNPKGKKLPLPMVVELNRRLVKGYERYKDDPRIVSLRKGVMSYNAQLLALNVRDHQLDYAKLSIFMVIATLFYRLSKLALLSAGVLPGLILFAPVFIAGKFISIKKSREALAASSVKIKARDVVATWKILVSIGLAPMLYTFYTILLAWWTYYDRVNGLVPTKAPLWAVVMFGFIFFPAITFAALRFGEIGMDIVKSLRPLILSLSPSSGNILVKLRKKRAQLATDVTELINTLGPEIFDDFESQRLISPTDETQSLEEPSTSPSEHTWTEMFNFRSVESSPDPDRDRKAANGGIGFGGLLPRNESFRNISNIGIFASHPPTPTSGHSRRTSRSRSRPGSSGGLFGSVHGFSTLDSKEAMDDVSKKIRGAMKERGQRRMSETENPDEGQDDEDSDSGSSSMGAEGEGLAMKKDV